jgi:hypothetical protein
MPKRSSKKQDPCKLVFRFTSDGLYIAGNKRGLLKLVSEMQWVAKGRNSYHSHLSFSWKKWLKAGGLVIDFEYIRKRFLRRATAPQADVTIMISDDIETQLPK